MALKSPHEQRDIGQLLPLSSVVILLQGLIFMCWRKIPEQSAATVPDRFLLCEEHHPSPPRR